MSPIVIAIDPGTRTHGIVVYRDREVVSASKDASTDSVCSILWSAHILRRSRPVILTVERISAMGIAGNDVVHTAELSARFVELAHRIAADKDPDGHPVHPVHVYWLRRRQVLAMLAVSGAKGSKDAAVRRAMIEEHGGTKAIAVGTKAKPGPLYGVTSHAWQALGLARATIIGRATGQIDPCAPISTQETT